MKDKVGIPAPLDVLERERTQAGGITLEDFTIQGVLLTFGNLLLFSGNEGWRCSCQIFQEHQTCRHLMALSRLLPSFSSPNLAAIVEGFSKKDVD